MGSHHHGSTAPPARLYRHPRLAFLAVLSLGVGATKVDAQPVPNCGPRDQVVRQLEREFRESPSAMGIAHGGSAIVEVFTSDGGATFTLILSLPNGQSCLLGAGTDWQFVFTLKGRAS